MVPALSTTRMFVAVWPPPPAMKVVAAAVAALQRRDPPSAPLRWAVGSQWHVTLRFLGEVDKGAAVGAFRSARLVEAGGGRAVAELGPVTERFGRRVLHVPVSGLSALASAVTSATAAVGRPPDDRPFTGHLTLARVRSPRGADLAGLAGHPVAARWDVGEIALVASVPGKDGARYETVEVLPLRD